MGAKGEGDRLVRFRERYPEKFLDEERIFSNINKGGTIFISTGCGEPMYLVSRMIEYVKSNPKAFFDTRGHSRLVARHKRRDARASDVVQGARFTALFS